MLEQTLVFGARMSPPDVRDYKISAESIVKEFPETFELSMPAVKDQGSVGSCVAHSIALVAEYYNKKQHDITDKISVGYIYGNRSLLLGKNEGMITRLAIAQYCVDGAPYNKYFAYHCEVPKIIELVDEKREELQEFAEQFRFTSYVKTKTVEEIKTALINGCPVIIAVDWQKDMRCVNGKMQSSFKEGKSGGHAIVIYGWTSEGWLIQNSWGTSWGTDGKAIWPYEYPIREHYAIIDEETSELKITKPFSSKSKTDIALAKILNFFNMIFYKIKHCFKKD